MGAANPRLEPGRHDPEVLEALRRVMPSTLANERTLPVVPVFGDLLPGGGLQRGWTVTTQGSAALSLAFALATQASRDGAWTALVGIEQAGLRAAGELGVVLERIFCVAEVPSRRWAEIVVAAADGADVVISRLDATSPVAPADIRRVQSRLSSKGAVLVIVGPSADAHERLGADLGVSTWGNPQWVGIGAGHGRLLGRQVTVQFSARRSARPVRQRIWLPDEFGRISPVQPVRPVGHVVPISPNCGAENSRILSTAPQNGVR